MKKLSKIIFQASASTLALAVMSFAVSCKPTTSFDLTTAKKEIEGSNKQLAELLSKNDSVGFANEGYTPDAKFFLPNSPVVVGRKNIQSVFGGVIKAGLTKIELKTIEVWGDEKALTEEGTYAFLNPKGTPVDKGKYIVVWKKEDGKWKIHRDCYNSDLPVPTAK